MIGECEICGEELTYAGWYSLCTKHCEEYEKMNYKDFREVFKKKGYHPK